METITGYEVGFLPESEAIEEMEPMEEKREISRDELLIFLGELRATIKSEIEEKQKIEQIGIMIDELDAGSYLRIMGK